MAVTTPLIATLSVLGLLLGGGAAAFTLDGEPSKSDQDCSKTADEWACYEDRAREACKDPKAEPRKASKDAPYSRPANPKESDECRAAYSEAIAEYCADHADDPRCSEQCATDGPRTASTDEYPSKCQSACTSSKESSSSEDRPKCATAEEPKKETSAPLLPGVPIVE